MKYTEIDRKLSELQLRMAVAHSDSEDDTRRRRRSDHAREGRSIRKGERKERKRRREREDGSRHKEKKKRKEKKKKKTRSRRRESSSESSSSSDSDGAADERAAATVDLEQAAQVVRTLLVEFPSIAADLLSMLQLLDEGQTAVISGIANSRVKTLLRALFPSLGLQRLRTPKDAYAAPTASKNLHLLETVASLLETATDPGSTEKGTGIAGGSAKKRDAPIGPTMPPTNFTPTVTSADNNHVDVDDDGDIIGPALPGTKGFRLPDERVEMEMDRRAKQIEEDEWRRARGEVPLSIASASGGREAWMTEMPENNKTLEEAMGGTIKPRTGKPAAFRSREPAKIDSTWFDAPEERERSKRAKLDMELLGYVRPENAAGPHNTGHVHALGSSASTNHSILPVANREADDDMRRQMDALREKRGPSLLEQHQQRVAEETKTNKSGRGGMDRSTWNRERDLTARRTLSKDDASRIIAASKEIGSKFTAPTVTRQFL